MHSHDCAVTDGQNSRAAMPNPEAYSYYDRTGKADAPNWSDKITAASLQPYFIYNSIVHAPLVAPTPLLIIHGTIGLITASGDVFARFR